MSVFSAAALVAVSVGCAHGKSQQAIAPARDDALEVEITAIRSTLQNGFVRLADGWVIVIDPTFARHRHAPGGSSGINRPAARHDALVKTLVMTPPATDDTLKVLASDPVIEGESAIISVTISFRRPNASGRRRAGYRTDEFGLRRTEKGWVVTFRENLGIS